MPIPSPLPALTSLLKEGEYEVRFDNPRDNIPVGILIRNNNQDEQNRFRAVWIVRRHDNDPPQDSALDFESNEISQFLQNPQNSPKISLFDSAPQNFNELIVQKKKQDKAFLNGCLVPNDGHARTFNKENGTIEISLSPNVAHRAKNAARLLGNEVEGLRYRADVNDETNPNLIVDLHHYRDLVKILSNLEPLTKTAIRNDFRAIFTSNDFLNRIENAENNKFRLKKANDANVDIENIRAGMIVLGIDPNKLILERDNDGHVIALTFNDATLKLISKKLGMPELKASILHDRCAAQFVCNYVGLDLSAERNETQPQLLPDGNIFIPLHSQNNIEDVNGNNGGDEHEQAIVYIENNIESVADILIHDIDIYAEKHTISEDGITKVGILLSLSDFHKLAHLNTSDRFRSARYQALNILCGRFQEVDNQAQIAHLTAKATIIQSLASINEDNDLENISYDTSNANNPRIVINLKDADSAAIQAAITRLGAQAAGLTFEDRLGEVANNDIIGAPLVSSLVIELKHYSQLIKTFPHLKTLAEAKASQHFASQFAPGNIPNGLENAGPNKFRWNLGESGISKIDQALLIQILTRHGGHVEGDIIEFNDHTWEQIKGRLGVPDLSANMLHNRYTKNFLCNQIVVLTYDNGEDVSPSLRPDDKIFIPLDCWKNEDDDNLAAMEKTVHSQCEILAQELGLEPTAITRVTIDDPDDTEDKLVGISLSLEDFHQLAHLNTSPRFPNAAENYPELEAYCNHLQTVEAQIKSPFLNTLIAAAPFAPNKLGKNPEGFTLAFDTEADCLAFQKATSICAGRNLRQDPASNSLLLTDPDYAALAHSMGPAQLAHAQDIMANRLSVLYFAPGSGPEKRPNFAKGHDKTSDTDYIEITLTAARADAYRSLFGVDLGGKGQAKLRLNAEGFARLFPNTDFNGALTTITQKTRIALVPVPPPAPQPNPNPGDAGFRPVLSQNQQDTRVQQLKEWVDKRNGLTPGAPTVSVATITRGDPTSPLYQVTLHNTTDETQRGSFTYNPRTNGVTAEKADLEKPVVLKAMLEVTGVKAGEFPLMEVTLPKPPNLTPAQKQEQLDLAVKMFIAAIKQNYIPIVESASCHFSQQNVLAKLSNEVKTKYETLKTIHDDVLNDDNGWGHEKIKAVESIPLRDLDVVPAVNNNDGNRQSPIGGGVGNG